MIYICAHHLLRIQRLRNLFRFDERVLRLDELLLNELLHVTQSIKTKTATSLVGVSSLIIVLESAA